ncbi:lysine-specific demethylase JMJ30-like [Sesamum indicum]|uniref:Lysine-specific demethylase JMJ30-like n=1 Tax=Sesamum indicum TaxID=4182 RepID=A0A6I9U914_SESIN|nr:lysine-specific demethylase JMJ30-like [Sesamum indicum]
MSTASSSSSASSLETPVLDSQLSTLLQRITEEGGYAFVSMAALAASGDTRGAEAAKDMAWEQLHSGPWHSVVPIWRDAYAMACLHVAKHHYSSGELELALRALDMGLIMGGLALRDDLNLCVGKVTAALRGKEVCENGTEQPKVEWCKDFNLAEMLRLLPVRSLSCHTVGRKSGLSLEGFLQEHLLCGSPVIISDCMTHWPAKDRWNDINYLKKVAGLRTVPVKVGRNYLRAECNQELITFSEFLERIQFNGCSSRDMTFLAQHQLFDQIQELKQDIVTPDYCFAGGGEIRSLNAWFGPPGVVTPLHYDPHYNLLAQVVGKKYIRLYPASLSEELYPHSESMLSNFSQVDLDNIDEKEFPEALDLEFLDCILEEGEMLYIPPNWWHYVRSLTTSFSVSFWWSHTGNPLAP